VTGQTAEEGVMSGKGINAELKRQIAAAAGTGRQVSASLTLRTDREALPEADEVEAQWRNCSRGSASRPARKQPT
jgi:hypothetical protein